MFGPNKVSQSLIDAVLKITEGEKPEVHQLDEAEKVATPTGMKVYGSSYGNSQKARADQTKKDIDKLKGPKEKEMKEELKGNQEKIDANHNGKIDGQDFKILRGKKKVKEGYNFASRLIDHAQFAEQVEEELNEVLAKDATAGDYIHDFVHSDNPKFAGKSKAERKKMALGAYYAKNESLEKDSEEHEDAEADAKEDKAIVKKMVKKSALKNEEAESECLTGKEYPAKSNSFKSFKVKLKGDNEDKAPEVEEPEDTPSRKSIKAKDSNIEIPKAEIKAKEVKLGEESELNEDNLDSIAKKHDMEFKRTTYGAGMKHKTKGEISINRYGEWKHYPAGSKTTKSHGDSESNFASLDKHLSSLKEESDVPKKNQDVADKSYLKDMGKKPTVKSDLKNFKNFLTGKKETNEEVELEEGKGLSPGQDDAPFDPPYADIPKNVKDKSGAVHTPMSRAKDLARNAMKRVKTEMLGKAPGNN